MERSIEQRYAIKFCVKLGKSGAETLAMLQQAFGEESLSKAQVYRWIKLFEEGREDVEDEPRSGRPSTSQNEQNVDKVRDVLNTDRRLSVRMVAERLGLPKTVVQEIVTNELAMRKVCAQFVPKVLTRDQKDNCVVISRELLERVQSQASFLDRLITGDETWIFEYDPETKRQSAEWHTKTSPHPKKARMSKSNIKSMLIVFFDSKGLVHKEFLPTGQTVNAAFYTGVLNRLRNRVIRVRKEIATTWVLHHDNAPSHTSLQVREFLAKHNVTTLPQPPYSPDLAPADFFLFPHIKRGLKGHRFETLDTVEAAATRALKDVSVAAFQAAYQSWQSRWQRCIDAQGSYFEDY